MKAIWREPRWLSLAAALTFLIVTGYADIASGYGVSLFPFYAIAIVLASICRIEVGYGFAIAAGCVWWYADMVKDHPYSSFSLRLWETGVRFLFFILVAFASDGVRKAQRAAAARIKLLEHSNELEHQIVEISEQEQKRIGRDLHDGLCQLLAAIEFSATSLHEDLARRGLADLAATAANIDNLLNAAVIEARNLARGLVPLHMDEATLSQALEELAASTTRLLGIQCTFDGYAPGAIVTPSDATHFYRIAQEAISNAHKHGKAKRIDIQLSSNPNMTILTISDDGVGISHSQADTVGIGLSTMGYRANAIGGELEIEEKPTGGTIVSCVIRRRKQSERLHAAA